MTHDEIPPPSTPPEVKRIDAMAAGIVLVGSLLIELVGIGAASVLLYAGKIGVAEWGAAFAWCTGGHVVGRARGKLGAPLTAIVLPFALPVLKKAGILAGKGAVGLSAVLGVLR